MQLTVQRRLAASIGKCSLNRVTFNPENLQEIKEAITKVDIKGLIKQGIIIIEPKRGISRARTLMNILQKRKGRRRGMGSRKGSGKVRHKGKVEWINRIRLQRKVLLGLIEKGIINREVYRNLYNKAGGGFFRSKRHLLLYIEERGLGLKTVR